MSKRSDLTVDKVNSLVKYDPDTGGFTWLAREGNQRFNTNFAGKPAFTALTAGYRSGQLMGAFVYAHRLAWFISNGSWPDKWIDHINGDPLDNRLSNLRQATGAQNGRNRGITKRTKTGYKGVFWIKEKGRYRAEIGVNRKGIYLGYFDDPVEAAIAYDNAAKKYHADFHNGNFTAAMEGLE